MNDYRQNIRNFFLLYYKMSTFNKIEGIRTKILKFLFYAKTILVLL